MQCLSDIRLADDGVLGEGLAVVEGGVSGGAPGSVSPKTDASLDGLPLPAAVLLVRGIAPSNEYRLGQPHGLL